MTDPQFTVKSFARGVKLTVQHVWSPAQDMATALGAAQVQGQTTTAPFKMNWCFTPQAEAFSGYDTTGATPTVPRVVLPMIFPPPQGEFDAATREYTYAPTLTELSFSWDQRANFYGITDESARLRGVTGGVPTGAANSGLLTDADLSRYDTILRLIEKTPTVLDNNGDSDTYVEVLTLAFPGQALFGGGFNPEVVDGLAVDLNPYKIYYWTMEVAGLQKTSNVAQVAMLAMPSFNLVATFRYPLVTRDYSASATDHTATPYVQNIPTKHLGQPQTKAFTLTPPAANTLITGDDVQQVVHTLEAPVLDLLRAGYGTAPGSEADTYPWEQLARDTGYQVINVQMFPNWWDVRGSDVYPGFGSAPRGCGFPYTQNPAGPDLPGPFTAPIVDQRVIAVPAGFVIHHIVACQNTFPYPGSLALFPGTRGWADEPENTQTGAINVEQKVGVGLYTGVRADNQKFQQVGYLEWDQASTFATHTIDRLKLDRQHTNMVVRDVPLVWGADRPGYSYFGTGAPFFTGGGNLTTAARTPAANAPFAYGGNAWAAPGTAGAEQLLVVRWSLRDQSAVGIGYEFANVALTGWGGHQVIIIGKQSTLGPDVGVNQAQGNGVTGQW